MEIAKFSRAGWKSMELGMSDVRDRVLVKVVAEIERPFDDLETLPYREVLASMAPSRSSVVRQGRRDAFDTYEIFGV